MVNGLLEKIFNPFVLLFLNGAVVIAAEFAGGGFFFAQTGLIHGIALLFIALAISRLFVHYYTFDPALEKFVHATLAALLVFSASHFMEFISYRFLNMAGDAIFANVLHFYLISLLLINVGAEFFLRKVDRRSPAFIVLYIIGIVVMAGLTSAYFVNDRIVTLAPGSPMIPAYSTLVAVIAALGIYKLLRIKNRVSIAAGFVNYLLAAYALIAISATQGIYVDILARDFGIPLIQIAYISHFTFYAALSFMFLAFVKFANLGGLYAAAQEELRREKQ